MKSRLQKFSRPLVVGLLIALSLFSGWVLWMVLPFPKSHAPNMADAWYWHANPHVLQGNLLWLLVATSSLVAGGILLLLLALTHYGRWRLPLSVSDHERWVLAQGVLGCCWVWGPDNKMWYGPGWKSLFEVSPDKASTMDAWASKIHPEDTGAFWKTLEAVRTGSVESVQHVCRIMVKNRPRTQQFFCRRVRYGSDWVISGSTTDITQHHELQQKLVFSAFHDALTGLPNRNLFTNRLQHAYTRKQRNPGYCFAVILLDLDDFKVVNDSLGHAIGDDLLKVVAHRLQTCVRSSDTVARMSGDEFTVLLEPVEYGKAAEVAQRLVASISGMVDLQNYRVQISACAGVAISGPDDNNAILLLQNADTAMYESKINGPGKFRIFDQAMHEKALRRLTVETLLRQNLDLKNLVVHYQPLVHLENGRIFGMEALVRMPGNEPGQLIPPSEFISLAEKTGLIDGIMHFVLDHACSHLTHWISLLPDIVVSINLSSYSMKPGLAVHISTILQKHGIPTSCIKLELTESLLFSAGDNASAELYALHKAGFKLSIDDFGTGYSSLSYLHQFPIAYIKLDRSFVNGLQNTEVLEIVQTVLTLSDRLHAQVIAEGIETTEQATQLQAMGCPYGQGYLFSRPVPAEEASAMLQTQRDLPKTSGY